MPGSTSSSGIFIKNVLPDSPAGRTGQLFTGDRLLEISGVPLVSSDHTVAVRAIKEAGDPVRFVVQSLVGREQQQQQLSRAPTPGGSSSGTKSPGFRAAATVSQLVISILFKRLALFNSLFPSVWASDPLRHLHPRTPRRRRV